MDIPARLQRTPPPANQSALKHNQPSLRANRQRRQRAVVLNILDDLSQPRLLAQPGFTAFRPKSARHKQKPIGPLMGPALLPQPQSPRTEDLAPLPVAASPKLSPLPMDHPPADQTPAMNDRPSRDARRRIAHNLLPKTHRPPSTSSLHFWPAVACQVLANDSSERSQSRRLSVTYLMQSQLSHPSWEHPAIPSSHLIQAIPSIPSHPEIPSIPAIPAIPSIPAYSGNPIDPGHSGNPIYPSLSHPFRHSRHHQLLTNIHGEQ
ncbi:hypothetical protein PGT21_000179 [Puccinia graminis f. sp. tritici]|uniref:Uncharacterized protein n=1 Tax=Puccinia graminis f. sp. tritici TaxID=56615 RepID=A0A5B0MIU9_PUCGR|nr:hypothetical protein PGT21_000179 [Puccinia graminis f. sp. tritici]